MLGCQAFTLEFQSDAEAAVWDVSLKVPWLFTAKCPANSVLLPFPPKRSPANSHLVYAHPFYSKQMSACQDFNEEHCFVVGAGFDDEILLSGILDHHARLKRTKASDAQLLSRRGNLDDALALLYGQELTEGRLSDRFLFPVRPMNLDEINLRSLA